MRALRAFVTVVELGSFSAAARHLGVAQPALSRQVRNLEAELGASLLVRTSKGCVVTEEGDRLFRYGLDLIRQLDMVPQVVAGPHRPITGLVTIALPNSAAAMMAKPLLLAAKEELPGVRIHLIESLSGFVSEWVQEGRVDLAVLFDAERSPNLLLKNILVEEVCLAGAPEAIPEGTMAISFRELSNYPLILPAPPHSLRRLMETMALSNGTALNIFLEIDSLSVTKEIIKDGESFAILAMGAVRDEVAAGTLRTVEIVDPRVSRSVSLATCALPGRSRACEEVGRLAVRVMRQLASGGTWLARSDWNEPTG